MLTASASKMLRIKNHKIDYIAKVGNILNQESFLVALEVMAPTRRGGGVSGGYLALFILELPACYHPSLGIFWGVWLFQRKCWSKI